MAGKKKPNHRSGPKGPARALITERNNARRRKKWLKKQARLKHKRLVVLEAYVQKHGHEPIKEIHKKRNPGPNNMGHEDRTLHTIRFRDTEKGTSTVVEGLRIDGSHPEGWNTLKEGEACIHFITKGGKKWSPRLSEFSFVIKPNKPDKAA